MKFPIPRLYAIIDPAQTGGRLPAEVAEALLEAGVRLIQYRDKRGTARELFETGGQVAKHVRGVGGTFVVNDRADVALALDADGVHIGREDLPAELARRVFERGGEPNKLIGCSTHTLGQVREADESAADYIAFGPIFATASKERPDPAVGLGALREAREATSKPLVAIGGITVENAPAVLAAGADSVAVIRDLLGHADIGARARQFLSVLGERPSQAR
jgi:thiamine-phosphate pyrophosphorylase